MIYAFCRTTINRNLDVNLCKQLSPDKDFLDSLFGNLTFSFLFLIRFPWSQFCLIFLEIVKFRLHSFDRNNERCMQRRTKQIQCT